jgi:hypothetical protein
MNIKAESITKVIKNAKLGGSGRETYRHIKSGG